MTTDTDRLGWLALRAARAGAQAIRQVRDEADPRVETKRGSFDLVTAADKAPRWR